MKPNLHHQQILLTAIKKIAGYEKIHNEQEGLSAFLECHRIAIAALLSIQENIKSAEEASKASDRQRKVRY